jgi:hypothetical protein
MKAIQVKCLGPTNHLGALWKAFIEGGASVTVPYDHSLDGQENARCAAQALTAKLAWRYPITGSGALPNGDYVFTIAS